MCGALGALVTVPTAAVTDILSPLDGLLRLDNNVEFRRIQCAHKDLTLIVWGIFELLADRTSPA